MFLIFGHDSLISIYVPLFRPSCLHSPNFHLHMASSSFFPSVDFAALSDKQLRDIVSGATAELAKRDRTPRRPAANPSGCKVPTSGCHVCGGSKPPAAGAEPWRVSETGVYPGSVCSPCEWATRKNSWRTASLTQEQKTTVLEQRRLWPGWEAKPKKV